MKKYSLILSPLIIITVYARSLPIYFSGDDWVFLYGALKGLDLPFIFRFSPGSFAPLINIAFLIFYKLFHLNAIYYHLVILFIHALNCILLYYIIQGISQNKKLAFLTTFLFSVFSPYNQIVIWIDGLPGLITSFFFLSSLYNFIMYRKKGKIAYWFFSLVSFISALLCKEWAVTVFALFILYDIFFYYNKLDSPIKSWNDQKLIKPYIPFILILVIYLSAMFSLPYSGKKDMIGPHIFSNLSTYLTTFILPSRNIPKFPVKAFFPLLNILLPFLVKIFSILLPVLSLIAIIRGPAFIKFYTLWIYITLLPFLFFSWGTASRYYYIPSMGFIAILAYLFLKLMDFLKHTSRKRILSICLGVFIIIHIFFVQVRITTLYRRNEKIRDILEQLQSMHLGFPPHSRLFFCPQNFSYSRKWNYAIRTVYRDPTLKVYRTLPTSEDLKEKSYPIFIFEYKDGELNDLSKTFEIPQILNKTSLYFLSSTLR